MDWPLYNGSLVRRGQVLLDFDVLNGSFFIENSHPLLKNAGSFIPNERNASILCRHA